MLISSPFSLREREKTSTNQSLLPAELAEPLRAAGKPVHLIGGYDVARELDARRAIAQGTKLALEI